MQKAPALPIAVVKAVSDANGIDPSELDYTVQEYVDLDALTQLATQSETPWKVSFELPDHSVTVTSDGKILIDGREAHTWI